jgi:hypothetical protein
MNFDETSLIQSLTLLGQVFDALGYGDLVTEL